MSDLPASFQRHLASLGLSPGRALVAVSGGPDSMALAHLLVRTRDDHGLELIVAHVDHGIHPDSAGVGQAVRRFAGGLGLPCEMASLGLGPDAGETEARQRRYEALDEMRRRLACRWVFTAHHADDQAETVLLRLLAGSGPAGLAAMPARQGALVRPLLPYRRAELLGYAEQQGLAWWDDPANADTVHLRSWVRGDLLPAIRRRLPEVDAALLRVAEAARGDREAWDAALEGLDVGCRPEADGVSVDAAGLTRYDSPLASALLRAAARRAGCVIGHRRSVRAVEFLTGAASGARFELGGGWVLELAFGRGHLVRPGPEPEPPDLALAGGAAGEARWGRWRLAWQPAPAPPTQSRDGLTAWFAGSGLGVRPWRAGDRLRPLGGAGSRLVVKCFQEARVPRHLRGRWPVVVAGDGAVLWVPGVCRSDAHLPAPGAEALRIDAAIR